MSGKPSKDGVERFLAAIERVSVAHDQISWLTTDIKDKQGRLEYQTQEYASAFALARKLMEEMDVSATGNFGYEGRAAWFFAELHRQTHKPEPVAVPAGSG